MQATKPCPIPDCEQPRRKRRTCDAHYFRAYRGRPLEGHIQTKGAPKTCTIESCERSAKGKDGGGRTWCSTHLQRWRLTGDPIGLKGPLLGESNHAWRGDDIGVSAAHERVKRLHGPATDHTCVSCGGPAKHWAYDHQDPNEKHATGYGPYSTTPSHYQPMCVPCHKRFDRAIANTR